MGTGNSLNQRLVSLDFFRGFTMFLLIIEFTNLFGLMVHPRFEGTIIYFLGNQFHHPSWEGFHFWDLIQPFFMFIVGVAMPLSYEKRKGKGHSHQFIFRHIIKRSGLLLFLGWWLYCMLFGKIVFFFHNVLAQLSVAIFISFLLIRKKVKTQVLFSFGLLVVTELVYWYFWIEGYNQPFTPDKNFGAWFDMLIAGRLFPGHWVSINVIPTTAHTIWGVVAGKLMMSNKENRIKLVILIAAGISGLIIGYGLEPIIPIIKKISTTTFIFVSGGWTFLALAFSFWLIDMMRVQRGVLFFAIVGMNPLFIYIFAHIGGGKLLIDIINPFSQLIFGGFGELGAKLFNAVFSIVGMWYICYWMYKRKLFIKL